MYLTLLDKDPSTPKAVAFSAKDDQLDTLSLDECYIFSRFKDFMPRSLAPRKKIKEESIGFGYIKDIYKFYFND